MREPQLEDIKKAETSRLKSREAAMSAHARTAEIARNASPFEHDGLKPALAL